jgi:hypothetical protein
MLFFCFVTVTHILFQPASKSKQPFAIVGEEQLCVFPLSILNEVYLANFF